MEELVLQFMEVFADIIKEVDELRDDIVLQNTFNHRSVDMGNPIARFIADYNKVAFCVRGFDEENSFGLMYHSRFEREFTVNSFDKNDEGIILRYDSGNSNDSFCVGTFEMSYPIQDEQYFQMMTVQDMLSQKFYQHYMDIQNERLNVIVLSISGDDMIESFSKQLSTESEIKRIKDSIRLLMGTYRMSNKIKKNTA